MTRRHLLAILAVLVALGVVAAVTLALSDEDADEDVSVLEGAVAAAPPDAARLLFTDWSALRARYDVRLDTASSAEDLEAFLDRGFDDDLTSNSALVSSAIAMQEEYGFSPATLDWELFTQSDSAAALAMRVGEEVDLDDDVARRLEDLGYVPPDSADGVWLGDFNTQPISVRVTPELSFLVLDTSGRTVYASDTRDGAASAYAAARQLEGPPVPDALVTSVAGATTAAIYTGDEACGALSMRTADRRAQAEASRLVAAAGRVDPLRGFAIAALPDGEVTITMAFDDAEEARANAESRARLATGAAPGQGGTFAERFTLDSATAEGSVVVLDVRPTEGGYVVSDLSSGPLLLATC